MQQVMNRFSGVAERFCALLEASGESDWDTYCPRLRAALAELIHEAHLLPKVTSEDETEYEAVSHEEWQVVYGELKKHLGVQEYWVVVDPLDHQNHEPLCGDLADDLADIWRDLQNGLRLKGVEEARPEDVIWEWRFGFRTHWGVHATSALACLHRTAP